MTCIASFVIYSVPTLTRNGGNGFIVDYNKRNSCDIDNNDSVDLRRVVFVSLIGIYKTWRNCPSHILYSSIFIVPLKRSWIYKKSLKSLKLLMMKYFQPSMINPQKKAEFKEFIELLRWKDEQRLIFWMLDKNKKEQDNNNGTHRHVFISPFWRNLSMKLTTLYDPVHKSKYKPLIFEENWWRNPKQFKPKFQENVELILSELYFVEMKYKSICEILYQSNPESLHPVVNYERKSLLNNNATDLTIYKKDKDELFILSNYHENEIDPDLHFFDYNFPALNVTVSGSSIVDD